MRAEEWEIYKKNPTGGSSVGRMDLQFEAVSIVDCFAVCSETLFFMDRFAMGDDGLPPIPA